MVLNMLDYVVFIPSFFKDTCHSIAKAYLCTTVIVMELRPKCSSYSTVSDNQCPYQGMGGGGGGIPVNNSRILFVTLSHGWYIKHTKSCNII